MAATEVEFAPHILEEDSHTAITASTTTSTQNRRHATPSRAINYGHFVGFFPRGRVCEGQEPEAKNRKDELLRVPKLGKQSRKDNQGLAGARPSNGPSQCLFSNSNRFRSSLFPCQSSYATSCRPE